MRATRQRQREAKERGDYATEAEEKSRASALVERIAALRGKENITRTANEEQEGQSKEELEEALRATRQRQREAKERVDYATEAEEKSRASALVERIAALKMKENNVIDPPKPQKGHNKSTVVPPPRFQEEKDFCDICFDSKTSMYTVKYRIDGEEGEQYTKTTKELSASSIKNKNAAIARYLKSQDYEFDDVFYGFDMDKIKHYDAKLFTILFSTFGKNDPDKGLKACVKYLEQLELGNKADKRKLPYTMKYDLRDMKEASFKDGKKMSFIERIRYIRMARNNEYVARVEPERNRFNWKGLAAIGAGVLIALGIGTHQKTEKYLPGPDRSLSDSDRGIKPDTNPDLSDEEKDIGGDKDVDKGDEDPFADIKIQGHNVVFGDIVRGTEGEKLTEASGREGIDNVGNVISIGEDATLNPVTGYYVVDRAASRDENGNVSAYKYALEGEIPEDMTYVHLSLVKGADTYEEAKEIVESQVETAKTTTVDQNILAQRGWASKDEVKVIFEKQQEERDKANNPVIIKPVDRHHQGLDAR